MTSEAARLTLRDVPRHPFEGAEPDELAPTISPSTPPPELRVRSISSNPGFQSLFEGQVLDGRWEVQERIGVGGMASVHAGVDRRLGRHVAIKILHPHVAENADSRERLAREARAFAQLKHENVIEVYDYSIEDPTCTWLVTELVRGQTLKHHLETHPKVMPEIAAMICSEIVRALVAAHASGVIHRDVKPENILIGRAGRPKLSDFGVAQILDERRITATGSLLGSPSYMSPEQAEGRPTDCRTDLFSAGIVLYRMVTGTLPFAGANTIDTLRKVARVEFIDPVEVEPACPGTVAAVIRRAMAPRIDDRYASAGEMLEDLLTILRDADLGHPSDELPAYFQDPVDYSLCVTHNLGRALFDRGKALLAEGHEIRGFDCMSRARALGVSEEESLDLVRVLSQRKNESLGRRTVLTASLTVAVVAILGGGIFASGVWGSREAPPSPNVPRAVTLTLPEHAPPPRKLELQPFQAFLPSAPKVELEPAPVAETTKKEATSFPLMVGPERRRRRESSPVPPRLETPPPAPLLEATALAPEAKTPEPASVAPAPPAEGALQVGATRWADLFLDGTRIGRAPDQSRYRLAAGPHRLKAENPHCKPLEQEVVIRSGETTRLRLVLDCP